MSDFMWGSVRKNVAARFEKVNTIAFIVSIILVGLIVFGSFDIPYHYMALFFLIVAVFLAWLGSALPIQNDDEVEDEEEVEEASAFVEVIGAYLFSAMMIGLELLFMMMTIALFWVKNNFHSMAGSIFTYDLFWYVSLLFVCLAFLFIVIMLYFVHRFNASLAALFMLLIGIGIFLLNLLLTSQNVIARSLWMNMLTLLEDRPGVVLIFGFVLVFVFTLFSIVGSYQAMFIKIYAADDDEEEGEVEQLIHSDDEDVSENLD